MSIQSISVRSTRIVRCSVSSTLAGGLLSVSDVASNGLSLRAIFTQGINFHPSANSPIPYGEPLGPSPAVTRKCGVAAYLQARPDEEHFSTQRIPTPSSRPTQQSGDGSKNISFDQNFPVHDGQPNLGEQLSRLAADNRLDKLLSYLKAVGLPEHREVAFPWLATLCVATKRESVFIAAGGQHSIYTVLLSQGCDSGPGPGSRTSILFYHSFQLCISRFTW